MSTLSCCTEDYFRIPEEWSHYEVLGIAQSATLADVKRAYLLRSREHHPDKHPLRRFAKENFQRVQAAYEEVHKIAEEELRRKLARQRADEEAKRLAEEERLQRLARQQESEESERRRKAEDDAVEAAATSNSTETLEEAKVRVAEVTRKNKVWRRAALASQKVAEEALRAAEEAQRLADAEHQREAERETEEVFQDMFRQDEAQTVEELEAIFDADVAERKRKAEAEAMEKTTQREKKSHAEQMRRLQEAKQRALEEATLQQAAFADQGGALGNGLHYL